MLLRTIILISLFSSTIFGEIEEVFPEDESDVKPNQIISIELGKGSIKRPKADTISGKTSIDRDVLFGGIKLGAEDIGLRLFLTYRPMEVDSKFTNSFGLELDSIIDLTSNFRFFYGLNVGGIFYRIVDENQTSDYTKKLTAYYGLESGLVFSFSQNYELEIGGRYSVTNINNDTPDESYIFDQFINYYLAFNYKY